MQKLIISFAVAVVLLLSSCSAYRIKPCNCNSTSVEVMDKEEKDKAGLQAGIAARLFSVTAPIGFYGTHAYVLFPGQV